MLARTSVSGVELADDDALLLSSFGRDANARAEALEVAEQAGSERLRADTMLMIGLKHLCYGELKEGKGILDDVVETARRLDYKPALCRRSHLARVSPLLSV